MAVSRTTKKQSISGIDIHWNLYLTRIIQHTIEIWASDSKNHPSGDIFQYLLFCCSAALLAVCVHYLCIHIMISLGGVDSFGCCSC